MLLWIVHKTWLITYSIHRNSAILNLNSHTFTAFLWQHRRIPHLYAFFYSFSLVIVVAVIFALPRFSLFMCMYAGRFGLFSSFVRLKKSTVFVCATRYAHRECEQNDSYIFLFILTLALALALPLAHSIFNMFVLYLFIRQCLILFMLIRFFDSFYPNFNRQTQNELLFLFPLCAFLRLHSLIPSFIKKNRK